MHVYCLRLLLGCPFSVAVAQVLRATGLHGSALLSGNYMPVAGISQQQVALGDLFYSIGGEASTFTEMLDRIIERLFGFCLPYRKKCSLNPEGLRVRGTFPQATQALGHWIQPRYFSPYDPTATVQD